MGDVIPGFRSSRYIGTRFTLGYTLSPLRGLEFIVTGGILSLGLGSGEMLVKAFVVWRAEHRPERFSELASVTCHPTLPVAAFT